MVCSLRYVFIKPHGLFLALFVYKALWSVSATSPFLVRCVLILQCYALFWVSLFGAPRFVFKFHASFLGAMLPCWRLAPFLFFECPEYFLNCLVYFLGAPCFLFLFECFVAFLSATCVLECHVCSSALCVFLKCCAYFWVPRVFWCHVCSSMLRVFFTAARIFYCRAYFLLPRVFFSAARIF